MRTIIIGGGAAGLAAAITAADCGDQVTLLEKCDRVGRKLLATGNGRCNLMNVSRPVYPGGADFAQAVLTQFGAARQRAFWEQLGLRLREEDAGRVYPVSGQASTVLDALRLALDLRGVDVRVSCPVAGLSRKGAGFLVQTPGGALSCDRAIVTGGGKAQPKLGSDGSCYGLLTGLGHALTPVFPALTQVETDTALLKGLSGIRVKTAVWVTRGGQELSRQTGEALFTDYGVSGVCVMQSARYAREKGAVLHLDLCRALGFTTAEELFGELSRRREALSTHPAEMLLTGLCVPRLTLALLRASGIDPKAPAAALPLRALRSLSDTAVDLALPVKGVKGFDTAQVTAGGIDTAGFDPATLASRLVPGLYAAGEVLDVDGDCGGFNLMFAFGSGALAGLAGREMKT